MNSISLNRGIVCALASAALFGASVPLAKLLIGTGVPSSLLAGLLYLGPGVGLTAIIMLGKLAGRDLIEAPLRRRDAGRLAVVIVSGGIIGPLLLMWGLARSDAASASLLLNIESLATMALAWIVFRENVDARILLGAAAILAGAVLISWSGPLGTASAGSLAIIGACMAWAIDNNVTRTLSNADPLSIAAWKGMTAGLLNVLLALAAGAHLPGARLFAEAGLVGFLGYGTSLVLFVLALRYLGVARTGAYYATGPFIGAIIAVVFLQEPLTLRLLAAGLLMGIGVLLHIIEFHSHAHAHVGLEHEHRHRHDAHHQHTHEGPMPAGEHSHWHRHDPGVHSHPHYPDLHHRHDHGQIHDDGHDNDHGHDHQPAGTEPQTDKKTR
jgi:drug/metabolite transporter (DMT)-like permease